MEKLLIIADDLTGALDTSAAFAERGIGTLVVLDLNYEFSGTDAAVQVIVIDSETRHASPEEAYQTVFAITDRARNAGITRLYKKTDSALRGCVGSELSAMLDASGASQLAFLPAYPNQRRTTIGGVQYLNGVPIHESVFGQDPFEPLLHSYIPDLIGEQSDVTVEIICKGDGEAIDWGRTQKRIMVFDAVTDEDLAGSAGMLQANGKLNVMAGCAGFAKMLPDLIEFEYKKSGGAVWAEGLIVICGSLNPITEAQIAYARSEGFHGVHLTPEQKLQTDYLESVQGQVFLNTLREMCEKHKRLVLDTWGDNAFERTNEYAMTLGILEGNIRKQVARRLGSIAGELVECLPDYALLLTGGDTLLGFMNQINCSELQPIKEIAGGAVLSRLRHGGKDIKIVTKSGGLGNNNILTEIARNLMRTI